METPLQSYFPRFTPSGQRWLRFGGLVLIALLAYWLLRALGTVLTPIAAALAIAYVLNPLVTRLERARIPRIVSVSVGMMLLILVGASLLLLGGVQLVQFARNMPRYAQSLQDWVTTYLGSDRMRALGDMKQVEQAVQEHAQVMATSILGSLNSTINSALHWATITVLLPMYTFYFLLEFNVMLATVRMHLPLDYRDTIVRIATTIDRAVADFFRGRLLVCLGIAVLAGVGWWIVGVPYALPLGALAGVLNLAPFLGILSLPPALILAYSDAVHDGQNWVMPVVWAMGVYMLVQAIESFLLAPYVQSRTSGLHTLTTIIALFVGAELAGVLGMLLAIPVASTLKSLSMEYVYPEVRRLAGLPPLPPPSAKRESDA